MRRSAFLLQLVALAAMGAGHLTGHAADAREQLFGAIVSDDAGAVTRLLAAGVDPNSKDSNGVPALYLALQEDALHAAQILLRAPHIDVNAVNAAGESPLMMAAFKDHMALAQQLVASGASIDPGGWTPLHYAATKGHLDMIRYLLRQGANINALSPNGTTPLMMAAFYGTPEAVQLLLKFHADTELKNQKGMTALDFARSAGRKETAEPLEQAVDLGW